MREARIQRKTQDQRHLSARDRDSGRESEVDVLREMRELKERAAEMANRVAGGAKAAKEQVMQKAADVTRAVADGIKEEAERIFDEQKGRLGSRAGKWGKAIHQAAHALHAVKANGAADVVDAAAERVEGLSSYLEDRSLTDLLSDAEDVARRHPGIMLGGMFVAGLLAARFVKASASREDEQGEGEGDDAGSRGGRSNGRGRGR